MRRAKKTEALRFRLSTCMNIAALTVSIVSVIFTAMNGRMAQETRPLSYNIKPVITEYTGETISTELEFLVTNGAIGNIRIMEYVHGQILENLSYTGGTIRPGSGRQDRSFRLTLAYENDWDAFYASLYVLVQGKDGSRDLGMVLYHIDQCGGAVLADYYSVEEVILAEIDPSKTPYTNALREYRELHELLRAREEL